MVLSEISGGDIPRQNDIEIIVFGPGYGECICIHIGSGEWIVVDSCSVTSNRVPIALEYFTRLGVCPNEAVQLIVATHWHDDHCRGLNKLLLECGKASFYISDAFTQKEFLTFVSCYRSRVGSATSSNVTEISAIFDRYAGPNLSFRRAKQGQCLYRSADNKVEITALSPSEAATHAFLLNAVEAMPKPIEDTHVGDARPYRSTAYDISPNEASVALVVKIGDEHIFLGADLENHHSADRGWNAVLDADNLPTFSASTFKIPHHGSKTGYEPRVWDRFVATDAVSIITPWKKGRSKLPTDEGLEALTIHTSEIYITADSSTARGASGKPSVVQRELNALGATIKKIPAQFGAVRLRKEIGTSSQWNVKCFGSSYRHYKKVQ